MYIYIIAGKYVFVCVCVCVCVLKCWIVDNSIINWAKIFIKQIQHWEWQNSIKNSYLGKSEELHKMYL